MKEGKKVFVMRFFVKDSFFMIILKIMFILKIVSGMIGLNLKLFIKCII